MTESDEGARRRVARFTLWLLLIAVVAGGVRVAYVAGAKSGDDVCGATLCGDAFFYSVQAQVLSEGGGFQIPFTDDGPAADHPPLTAIVATPAVWLPGKDPVPAQRYTMVLVGTAAVVVIGLLGRAVAGPRSGLLAAGLAAVYPNLWINDGVVMSESLTALGVATCLLLTYRLIRDPTLGASAWLGAAIGVTILARAEIALYLPLVVLPVVLWMRDLDLGRRIGRIAVIGGVAVAVLLPWTTYNVLRFERPVAVSTNDGLTLLGANCDQVYEGPALGIWTGACAEAVPAEGDQSEVSATYRRAALDHVADNLDRVPVVVAARLGRVWGLYQPLQTASFSEGEGRERWASTAGMWFYYPTAVAAVAGAVVLRRRRTPVWPLLGTAVMVTLTAAALYGLTRFRVPAEVSLVVLAAVAVDAVLRRIEAARSGSARPSGDLG